jgi:hypothetical protein
MPREVDRNRLPRISLVRELSCAILFCLVATSPLWAADWLDKRREAIETMTPSQREELDEKYQRFLKLPPATQEQLHELYDQLQTDPNGPRLQRIMQRYFDWLKTLSPGEQAELASQPSNQARVALVEQFKHDQEATAAGSHLTPEDSVALNDWVKKYAVKHESELKHEFPHWHSGPAGENGNHGAQLRAWYPWMRDKLPHISAVEIDDLASKLSQKPRAAIESNATTPDKEKLVQSWLQTIARLRFANRTMNPAMLAQFFQKLDKKEQQRLLDISDREQRQRELIRLYTQTHPHNGRSWPGGPGSPRFNGPGHPGPPPDKHVDQNDPTTSAGDK